MLLKKLLKITSFFVKLKIFLFEISTHTSVLFKKSCVYKPSMSKRILQRSYGLLLVSIVEEFLQLTTNLQLYASSQQSKSASLDLLYSMTTTMTNHI